MDGRDRSACPGHGRSTPCRRRTGTSAARGLLALYHLHRIKSTWPDRVHTHRPHPNQQRPCCGPPSSFSWPPPSRSWDRYVFTTLCFVQPTPSSACALSACLLIRKLIPSAHPPPPERPTPVRLCRHPGQGRPDWLEAPHAAALRAVRVAGGQDNPSYLW